MNSLQPNSQPMLLEKSTDTNDQNEENKKKKKHIILSPPSPPSSTSSPSHEFTFTISLHSSTTTTSSSSSNSSSTTSSRTIHSSSHSKLNKDTSSSTSSLVATGAGAIDLSPADEIFFHGHLLPLHLISHLNSAVVSSSLSSPPRASLDSFTLPITEFSLPPPRPVHRALPPHLKPKSFSIFNKWKNNPFPKEIKRDENKQQHQQQQQQQKSRISSSNTSSGGARLEMMRRVVQRYMMRMFGRRRGGGEVRRESPSSSSSASNNALMTMNRRPYSAPASIKTSPSNSGLLVPTPTSDGTMDDLHAAIQAAIAHCKNSIAAADRKPLQHQV